MIALNRTNVEAGRLGMLLLTMASFCWWAEGASAQNRFATENPTLDPGRSVQSGLILTQQATKLNIGGGWLEDDQADPVSVDFAESYLNIGEGRTGIVKVRLSKRPSRPVTISLDASPGNGATIADYQAVPPNVSFETTDTEQTFAVKVLADTERDDDETITIGFVSPLPDGVVAGVPATITVRMVDDTLSPATDVLDALRARVTGGAIFSNGRPTIVQGNQERTARFTSPQFGQASTYLAFEAQPRLLPSAISNDGRFFPHCSLEPIVNVRLTTIPVSGAGSSAAPSAKGDHLNMSNSGGPVTDSKQSDGDGITLQAVLQSQKAVQVEIGMVANWNFGEFGIADSRFHWAAGLAFRQVFQSVTDAQRTLRIWNIDDDLYDGNIVGGRLALNGRSESSRVWLPTAYIGVYIGRFQNFEMVKLPTNEHAKKCLKMPFSCLTNPPDEGHFDTYKELRTYIEGRVFFKSIYLGFDLNNGDGYDDLQLSVGLTLPLSKFLPGSGQD